MRWCRVSFVIAVFFAQCSYGEDPEVNMNVSQVIKRWGFPVENYDVTTSDGYILTIQRIPHGRNGRFKNVRKPVVYLQHGLIGSAAHFVLNPANESLAFILADKGFDVWLGNSRGNEYSMRHKTLSPKSAAFWNFSWDEFAKYDIPATIDVVLNISGAPSLSYIGHSQGTTIAFAEFSRNQTWVSKIDIFIAMAPVSYVGNMLSVLRYLADISPEVEFLFKLLGVRDLDLPPYLKEFLAERACGTPFGREICTNLVFLICGFDRAQLNETRLPVYTVQILGGTSVKDIVHWAQLVKSKRFCMYDYGAPGNMQHYGQATPPSYNVSNIHVPTALFTGGNDWLADPKDVAILIPQLKNVVYKKYIDVWDHMDFILGRDAPQLVYPEIEKLLQQYGRKPVRNSSRRYRSKKMKST